MRAVILAILKRCIVFVFCLFPACAFAAEPGGSFANVEKSEHFIVYYQDSPQEQIRNIISASEKYYSDTAQELGFTRFDNFWTWEKRAKIYVYSSAKEYAKATGQPEWSAAQVNPATRQIQLYPQMQFLYDNILPHEIGHIVFREFVGLNRYLPLWLDEGVACHLEKNLRCERFISALAMVRSARLISIGELNNIKRGELIIPGIFYAISLSVVEFLLHEYGREKFFDFCRALSRLKSGEPWMAAVENAYHIESLEEMDLQWKEFMLKYSNEGEDSVCPGKDI